jgi:hypothetical protein
MKLLVSVMLGAVGIIHLLPLSGVLGSSRLKALYGVPLDDPSLVILMRHRAVLFGILGVFLLVSAFRSELQIVAFSAGFISVGSFLFLAGTAGEYNARIRSIFLADLAALACLLAGLTGYFLMNP